MEQMERCRVLRIEEQMYGCEELPEGAEVCCDVTVEAADGTRKTLSCPDAALIRQGIGEGDRVLWDGMELKKERNSMKKIETSALIGLGALGILFGRKMPGVKVIADAGRIARYSARWSATARSAILTTSPPSRASRWTSFWWPSRPLCWNRPSGT